MKKMIMAMNSIDHVMMADIFMSSWKFSWPLIPPHPTHWGAVCFSTPATFNDWTIACTCTTTPLHHPVVCKYHHGGYLLLIQLPAKVQPIRKVLSQISSLQTFPHSGSHLNPWRHKTLSSTLARFLALNEAQVTSIRFLAIFLGIWPQYTVRYT